MSRYIITLAFALVLSLGLAVPASAFQEELNCSSGLACDVTDECGNYMLLGYGSQDTFSFSAEAGTYNCDIEVESCCSGYFGSVPESDERSDVYLNNMLLGRTDDPYCNGGEADGCDYSNMNDCEGAGCSWQEYVWYGNPDLTDGECFNLPCRSASNRSCYPGSDYFPVDFSGSSGGCCSCLINGDWCGDCSASDPDRACGVKSPKYCHDVHSGADSCRGFGPGGVQCTWEGSRTVLSGMGGNGMPDNNGVLCSVMDPDPLPGSLEEKYANLMGFHHFQNPAELGYICCFAQNLGEGMYCLRGGECLSGVCQNNACVGGGPCDNDGTCEPGQGETHENCPDDCCETDADCGSGKVCCSNTCYTGDCCDNSDCFFDEICQNHYCIMEETHKECVGTQCEDVQGPGPDSCTRDSDCVIETAGGSETGTDSVRFGLYLGLFDLFGPGGRPGSGAGETTLYFASSGCLNCTSVRKTFHRDWVALGATNTIRLETSEPHGLRRIVVSCEKLQPPVAVAGPDRAVNLTEAGVTVYFSGAGSYDPDGTIIQYEWDFGDGGLPGYGSSISHDYYSEGRYDVVLNVTDDEGFWNTDAMELAVNDMPTITDDYAYDGTWVNTNQIVNLDAQDPSSIVKAIRYCQGEDCDPADGQLITSSPTISFTQDINDVIRYKAWDTYDNPSGTGSFEIRIDKTTPTTTDDADGNIHGDNYVVTLSCSDSGSGCSNTYYCVSMNGSTTCDPTAPGTSAVVTCEAFTYCEKVVRYYSTDSVGNQEQTKTSGIIRIDTRIPACSMGALGAYTTSENVPLSWSGTDPGGGAITGYKVEYRMDSGSWSVWNVFGSSVQSGTFTGEDGHLYGFRCLSVTSIYPDGGSRSATVSTLIDTTPPAASVSPLPRWANRIAFQVSWSAQDSGSGVKDYDVRYSIDNSNWNSWLTGTLLTSKDFGNGDPVDVSDGVTYYFRARASDRAGLQGDWSVSRNTSADLSGPVCSIQDLPEYVTGSELNVSWSAQDSGSGVNDYDVQYSIDNENWAAFKTRTTITSETANLMDRTYYFRCMARDNVGNAGGWSASEDVTVDTRAPSPALVYGTSIISGGNITVNATVSDASGISEVKLIYGTVAINETARMEVSANAWNVSWNFRVYGDYGSSEFVILTEDIHGNSRDFRYSFSLVMCEEGGVRICGTDLGECRKGNQTCVDGIWGDCLGGLDKTKEVCDGKDNDCDGVADDGIVCVCVPGETRGCGTDTGECRKGAQVCTEEQEWGLCTGNYIGPQPEICDGEDNDCNGVADNGANCCPEGKKRPCGFSNAGICEFGESLCRNGVWGKCTGEVMPQDEVCDDGIDQDCDGAIDEDCGLCGNNIQDGDEEGVDCGGSCPPCQEFPWIILSIIGVVILVIIFVLWRMFSSRGEELTWESLRRKWSY